MSDRRCVICGKVIKDGDYYIGSVNGDVCCSDECHEKYFWNNIIKDADSHIVVDGLCYTVDRTRYDSTMYNGFAGKVFWIKKFNGEEFTTNNLWFNGKVPNEYRSQLPDNARFLK